MRHFDLPDRQLLDAAPDAMVVVDQAGTIVLVNRQTESLFGYSRDELLGQQVEKLMPDQYRDRHMTHRQHFFRAPHVRPMGRGLELCGQHKDGTQFPIEISLSAVQSAQGSFVASAIRDVTARKEAELALKNARDVAESATAMKSRFLAAASHDLRQPLHSLGLYLSVMTRQLAEPNLLQVSDKMRNSLDTMGELLDALLDISKLDSGSVVPVKRDVAINELLDRIVTDNIQQAHEKGLQVDCPETDCVVHSDPVLLERVLENYVTNAIRYTEQGRVSIDCDCSHGMARISVSDTGIGIPKDDLDKVFEEYYQLDNQARDRRKGLGLGLSIVKHIARLLDHPIGVVSAPGEGSTFTIDLPLGEPIAVQAPPPKHDVGRAREPAVLFVDDDLAILDATMMLLKSYGVEVHSALCGDDALACIKAGFRPDIVVSDYRLPGYNGVEMVRRVRQATVEDLPAIIMTGDTSGEEIRAANLSHCTVLHKPANIDQLIALIQNAGA